MNSASERILKHMFNDNLPDHLKAVAYPVYELAQWMATVLDSDNPVAGAEVTTGLRKLREAKDCFVIAAVELHDANAKG